MARQFIAARKPFYNDQISDEFNWWVGIFYQDGAESFISAERLIIKRSPTAGLVKPLRLNVSTIARDYFFHKPNLYTPFSTSATTVVNVSDTREYVEIDLMATSYNDVPFAEYSLFDGWEVFENTVLAVSNESITRKIFTDTPGYISGKISTTENIEWQFNGQVISESLSGFTVDTVKNFPIIHEDLNITGNTSNMAVVGKDVSNNELWRLNYEFVCPYDEKHTIGFLNKYGTWEFVDVSGNKSTKLRTSKETYRKYETGNERAFANNGYYEYEFNTGWVDRGFADVIEGMILSEHVVLYKGDGTEPAQIIIDEKNINIQDSRSDKMVNYELKVKVAQPVIPIT